VDTTASHTIGDLAQVSNAKGQVTRYTQYDKLGRVLQSVDPNGVTTITTYDQRQRLKSVNVGGQITTYTYWPTGLLRRVTSPDLNYVEYAYDVAQRLTTVTDALGNRIEYTSDSLGNRTAEKVKDPGGSLTRQLNRTIDALGRVQQTIGRP
jgi:YD repeat-containing protein